jgi:hypothetical protein
MKGYEVALGPKVESLIAEVERLSALGYIPQGGIAISESYGRMAQAMVLRKGPPVAGPGEELATITLYPTIKSVPRAGGSGSVNLTITSPGTWAVDPASIPGWVTVTPVGPQTTDVQIVYSVAANTTGAAREAVIRVNAATLTLDQSG